MLCDWSGGEAVQSGSAAFYILQFSLGTQPIKIVFSSQFFNIYGRFAYVASMFLYFRASSVYFSDP